MSGMQVAGGQSAGVVKKYQCTRVANNRVGVNHWNSAAKASKFSDSPTESHSVINNSQHAARTCRLATARLLHCPKAAC